MRTSVIRSSWLGKGGYRLDCSPYLGGALETEILLEKLSVRKDSLSKLKRAIFNGPKFSRTYVDNPTFGVPFLGGSSLQQADLTNLPFLSKTQAHNKQLRHLEVKRGMTLITCSGTIGRMTYARPDMEGMWASQHIMKIVSDDSKIPSGYLYAFLSSKFGVPLVISGTYGSIIQSIEPHHVEGLSVPRFGEKLETEIHELLEESAKLLSEHSSLLKNATDDFFASVDLADVTAVEWHKQKHLDLGFSVTNDIPYSFRSLGFAPRVLKLIESIKIKAWKSLGEICTPGLLSRSGRFTRIDASPEFGSRMIGQRELFSLKPEGRLIANSALPEDAFVEDGTIGVAAQGTLGEGELYCRAQFLCGPWTKYAFSEHVLRILASEAKMLRGCLFAFMRSETAFRMLRSVSSGSKLQDHNYWMLPRLPIPVPNRIDQERIDEKVRKAFAMRHSAVAKELEAVQLVENAILQGSR
jgi:hypothetical protein